MNLTLKKDQQEEFIPSTNEESVETLSVKDDIPNSGQSGGNMAAETGRLEIRADNIGRAVRALQDDLAAAKTDIAVIKEKISDLTKFLMVGAPAALTVILAVMGYFIHRQNILSDQMINLLQQIANK